MMKLIRRLSLCLIVSLAGAGLAHAAPEAVSEYQKAVNAYVEAAGNELQALRSQADAAAASATEKQKVAYQEFYAAYEKCAATFEKLKQATAKDFDPMKALYEQQRQATGRALAKAQQA